MAQATGSKRPQKSTNNNRKRKSWWKTASAVERTRVLLITVLSAILAVVLVVSCAQFVHYRIEVQHAQTVQHELEETYDFDPGNIISDEAFFDGDSMSATEIQTFLNDKGAACSGDQCLKSKWFDTEPRPANEYCKKIDLRGQQTAATIIAAASEACSVSPKVLLTMLQKEQHLVSATDISDFQYKSAMGLSCPDDADCDPAYAGFYKQVAGSAERYQYYVQNEQKYGYHADSLNYIQYNPNAACGGSQVWIENKATALLYIYTPYQPNRAALQAGTGEGDQCSTYGNRNFSIIYSSWFGDPRKK
ncbi:hemagglutinin [Bifidobacterium dolichotidis]|uniref:Hemagglutinin n=1 Tax=Bifidobacterium dolichotidis TaxID=2306976 RepID=A0A430FS18_9BIFI|nr:hemagglutinin [Bifidobacterium dolichotidis]RSX55682.1 hemagglutinin [Bifidobacterium dolichotidis]